jgi:hypothetical protein
MVLLPYSSNWWRLNSVGQRAFVSVQRDCKALLADSESMPDSGNVRG